MSVCSSTMTGIMFRVARKLGLVAIQYKEYEALEGRLASLNIVPLDDKGEPGRHHSWVGSFDQKRAA